jgi:hypothetical protein
LKNSFLGVRGRKCSLQVVDFLSEEPTKILQNYLVGSFLNRHAWVSIADFNN